MTSHGKKSAVKTIPAGGKAYQLIAANGMKIARLAKRLFYEKSPDALSGLLEKWMSVFTGSGRPCR
jgi:hypothetical protein